MSSQPVQTRWWGLRFRDVTRLRDMSFPKELIVPALNAGGLDVRPGEFRINPSDVEVMFQSNTRRNKVIQAFKNWVPMGTDGPLREIWHDWDPIWPNEPPFRAINASTYGVYIIRRELQRLIRIDEETFEGIASDEEVGAEEGTTAAGAASDDAEDDEEEEEDSEDERASCPLCGANESTRHLPWDGQNRWKQVNLHILQAHRARHATGYRATEQGIRDMLAATA